MKTFTGKVVSTKMKDTIVVEVTRRTAHPLYRKLLKRSSRIKAHAPAHAFVGGETVKIVETKPISKDKHFKIVTEKTTVSKSMAKRKGGN